MARKNKSFKWAPQNPAIYAASNKPSKYGKKRFPTLVQRLSKTKKKKSK